MYMEVLMNARAARLLGRHPAAVFFALSFGLAWAVWLPVGLLFPERLALLALPGAWAPTLSADLLTALLEGREGLRQLWRRVLRWRVKPSWYGVVLFGVAAIAGLSLGLHRLLGGSVPAPSLPEGIPDAAWLPALPLLFLANVVFGGPLAEEVGWRGYALPALRRSMSALRASLIIGVAWPLWHLPFFLSPHASSVVGGVPFVWFVLLGVAWSVLFSWVYVNTESILLVILFHAAINTTLGTLGILGQGSGDLTPLVLNVGLTWLVVVLVITRFGADLVRRREAASPLAAPGHADDAEPSPGGLGEVPARAPRGAR
jgi:membrane protease YdiL (CAAX protease family)